MEKINIENLPHYSVLMSVYFKEKPDYLRQSMLSMWNQTVRTNDFILVCDGPLTEDLDAVVEEMQQQFGTTLLVFRLQKNGGLGNALNEGLKYCQNELVARMDSDDISRRDRCEKQLQMFADNPELSFCSGTVSEFVVSPSDPTGKRELPLSNEEIRKFSRKRNPMNHPCVMFKKSAVISVGGYDETYHLFEDYYLWIRILKKGYIAENTNDVLLDMRTSPDIYQRRGGKKYAEDMLRFHKWLKQTGWSSEIDFLTGAVPHAIICILPNSIRALVYKKLH